MKTYKWQLRNGSKKEVCPNCGKQRFVPFVLSSDNTTMAGPTFGRCDRENSCGYFLYPTNEFNQKDVVREKTTIAPKKKPTFINKELVNDNLMSSFNNDSMFFDNSFVHWFVNAIGIIKGLNESECRELVKNTFSDYMVGIYGSTNVVYWQTDINGNYRSGKVMAYGTNGKRNKACGSTTWMHSSIKDFVLEQCFFGEHLMNNNTKPICVVESEKTALFMSVLIPDRLWLASGGSHGLAPKSNKKKVNVLKGKDVTLFPDLKQYWYWLSLSHKYGFATNGVLESVAPKYMDESGADILDYILYECNDINTFLKEL